MHLVESQTMPVQESEINENNALNDIISGYEGKILYYDSKT